MIYPSRFLLNIFQTHLNKIIQDPDCLAIMIYKGLEGYILHDDKDASISQIEIYKWTLETCLKLARDKVSNVLTYVHWFANTPPLSSAIEMRHMALMFRELERMSSILNITPFIPSTRPKNDDNLKVGLFRYNYASINDGGTGEVELINDLLLCIPPDISFYYLGLSEAPKYLPGDYPYIKLNDDVSIAINQARSLKLDVIIFTSPLWGSFLSFMSQLISHRIATSQIYFAGDVMTSGIPSLDYYITFFKTELVDHFQKGFTEKLLNLSPIKHPVSQYYVENTLASMEKRNGIVTYVTNCNVFKINYSLLLTWARILASVPNSRILLCPFPSHRHRLWSILFNQLIRKVCSIEKIDQDRFVVCNVSGSKSVTTLLANGQIYLDSFPFTGSTSTAEALNIGLPCVCLVSNEANHTQLCRLSISKIEMEDDLIVYDLKSYIERAVNLGNDFNLRKKMSLQICKQLSNSSIRQPDPIFSSIFWKKIRQIVRQS